MATETVLSPLLSDKPADPKPKPRPVSKDYAATEDAGYIESLEAFGARISVGQAGALTVLAALASFRLLLWGHHTWRATA